MGLTVTDEDREQGIVFFSRAPTRSITSLLQRAAPPSGAKLAHQVSWRVDSLRSVIDFHHGSAPKASRSSRKSPTATRSGSYLFDPEGNRNEVILRLERDVRQPVRKTIDLDQDPRSTSAEAYDC